MNDPISEYLPEFENAQVFPQKSNGVLYAIPVKEVIRIQHLLSMTYGITNSGMDSETAWQLDIVLQRVKQEEVCIGQKFGIRAESRAIVWVPLAFEPESHWK